MTCAVAVCLGQADVAAAYGFTEDRKNRDTYILILENGERLPVYLKPDQKYPDSYTVEIDYPPWSVKTFLKSKVSLEPERSRDRYERIKAWFLENGYQEVGKWRFYDAREVDWARRARELAAARREPADAPEPAVPAASAPAVPAERPGVLVQWGAHGALVLVVSLLVVLIFRTLIWT